MTFVWLILFSILAFFVWAALHELAHGLAAKLLLGRGTIVHYKLYPHFTPSGRFVFAEASWGSLSAKALEPLVRAKTMLAPRIPDIIGAILFPFTAPLDFSVWWSILLAVLAGGALVDLFVGSLGIAPDSDLRAAASTLYRSPWKFRIIGFSIIAISAGIFLLRSFL